MSFLRKTINWEVGIPPNEVWRRIESASDPKTKIFFSTPKNKSEPSFFYTIVGDSLIIQKKQKYRNRRYSDQPKLGIEIKPTVLGSSLNGSFSSNLIIFFHLFIFLFITSVFCVLGISFYKFGLFDQSGSKSYLFIAFPVLIWLFFVFTFIRNFISRRRIKKEITNLVNELFTDVTINRN